jgi:lysophospholipase L1-like esterase
MKAMAETIQNVQPGKIPISKGPLNFTHVLLVGAGLIFIGVAGLYHPALLEKLDPIPSVPEVLGKIATARVSLLAVGLALLLIHKGIRRTPALNRWARKTMVTNFLLSFLVVAAPITMLELSLKPFARSDATTIFIRDETLGWRLQPGAESTWGGVPVKINGKGLRGPELPYKKPEGATRILYLGDSVTFGFMLPRHEETFPYQVETLLEQQHNDPIETINAGVGGYSPWQEYRYFAQEGIKYDPDLVVVSFVLNDVTEKFELIQYGGYWEGFQITHTRFSAFDDWASHSSLLYFLKQLGIYLHSRQEVRQKAIVQQTLEVEMLARQPDHPDVQAAWAITLDNLEDIVVLAQDQDIPVILVSFPFAFQFEDVEGLSAPQQRLAQFAHDHDLPVLNLLPLLNEQLAAEGLSPEAYFLDEDHLTAWGGEVVAEMIVEFLQREGLAE